MRIIAVLLLTLAIAGPARAEHEQLTAAKTQYDAFEYERALEILEGAIADQRLQGVDRIEALALKGRILVGFACDAKAIGTYQELLRLEPSFALGAAESPKVVECFEFSRETLEATTATPADPTPTIPTTSPTDPPVAKTNQDGFPTWGWVAIGTGVVAAIAGGVALGVGLSRKELITGSLGSVPWNP